jgi:SUMO ligase MMS21 Smc5/6 complex component
MVDTDCKCGVECKCNKDVSVRDYVTPALLETRRIMREIRASGKCGEFTIKWNGAAWEIRKCEPPIIVRDM